MKDLSPTSIIAIISILSILYFLFKIQVDRSLEIFKFKLINFKNMITPSIGFGHY